MRLFLPKTDTKWVSYNLLVHCIVSKHTASSTDAASATKLNSTNFHVLFYLYIYLLLAVLASPQTISSRLFTHNGGYIPKTYVLMTKVKVISARNVEKM